MGKVLQSLAIAIRPQRSLGTPSLLRTLNPLSRPYSLRYRIFMSGVEAGLSLRDILFCKLGTKVVESYKLIQFSLIYFFSPYL